MTRRVMALRTGWLSGLVLLLLCSSAFWLPTTAAAAGPDILSLTSSVVPNQNGWGNDKTVTFTWTVADDATIAGFSYVHTLYEPTEPDETIDTQSTSVTLPGSTGIQAFSVRACDTAGNWGPPQSIVYQNDCVAPTCDYPGFSGGPYWDYYGAVCISVPTTCVMRWRFESPLYDGSGMWYEEWSYDGGPWTVATGCDVPAPADHSNDGHHVVMCRGHDLAGNVTEVPGVFELDIDTRAPELAVSGADGLWHSRSAFQVVASDFGLGVLSASCPDADWEQQIEYHDGMGVPSMSIDLPSDFPDGIHTLTYSAQDAAYPANVAPAQTAQIKVDSSAPATTATGLQSTATSGWRNRRQRVVLSAVDPLSGVATTTFSLDRATRTYGRPFRVRGEGSHTVTYFSTDAAGNVEAASTGYVNIDSVRPSTTARDASARPGGRASLRFTVHDPLPSCGRAAVTIQIVNDRRVVATLPVGPVATNQSLRYDYTPPTKGTYAYRVLATDIAGNVATSIESARLSVK